jgi:CheY-like chemotaxis protein
VLRMAEHGRILLADDDPAVQRAVRRRAEGTEYEFVAAVTGAEALQLAQETRFDLIVLDVNLPDADGRDVLARLKANKKTCDVPVLVWSGGDAESQRKIAIELGAEDYVEKTEAATLIRKIERLLYRLNEERSA